MRFMVKTGNETTGKHLVHVECLAIETDSFHPRTNRRKLKAWVIQEMGIHPTCAKKALKMLGFWEPDRIGYTNYADRAAAIAGAADEAKKAEEQARSVTH